MEKSYTVVKCKFNNFGEIIGKIDLGLESMTLAESQTFRIKMTNPDDWLIIPIK